MSGFAAWLDQKRARLVLVSLVCFVVCALFMPVPSASAAGTDALKLDILSSQRLAQHHYVFVRGAMSGDLTRADGSTGTFKVPVWLVYPRNASRCNGFGVVEPVHTVGGLAFLGELSDAGEGAQPFVDFATVADGASLFGREHGGYVWAGVVWSQGFLDSLKGTEFQGIAIDDSYHIENNVTDRYLVLQAASLIERDPAASFRSAARIRLPCAAKKVIAGGQSQTGLVLRSFYFNKQNTNLASDSRFRDGFVFDGSIQTGILENDCRDLAGDFYVCSGPTPADEGKVITVNSEHDVQSTVLDPDLGVISGLLVRGRGPNWRIYEIAGVSHIPTWSTDFKAFGIKPASMPDQNYADSRPVYRAMVEHLRKWIKKGGEPPPNALLEGTVMNLQFREDFDMLPWFMPSAFGPPSFDLSGDYDLNADGGVRLPHLRTKDFGGPLGLYRGLECNNPRPLTDALACPLVPAAYLDNPELQLLLLGGSFVPYTALSAELSAAGLQNPCDRYTSHRAYVSAVRRAAKYAVGQRWVLPDEVDPMVSAAEEKAAQYPGCAPTP